MTTPFDLDGHVAVVTGGNNGIGLGMARGLAKAGASVAIWGRNTERNESARAELDGLGGGTVTAHACDVARPEQVTAAMEETLAAHGRLDALIANAGIGGRKGPFHEMTLDDFHWVSSVNVDGVVLSFQAAIKQFMKQNETAGEGDRKGGALVGVASLAGIEGAAGNVHYGATKGAVLSIVRGVASEYGRHNIRVNSVLPGWIATDMTEGAQGNDVFTEKVIKRAPIRRWGSPDDFEGIAAYLAGPGAMYTSGQQFVIDGGYSIF
ncbi:SDR family NAD(P)-dependent oxidoreductase [Brevibacterium litoralis]|uniref:SDR family NAD(P)-dependent oxidoreductase n=1 Tax=Brevibacterium litoralis TaxID=3138935 RepID=UPI0032EDE671